MIRNYFKTAWRNLQRNKLYSTINIAGIAIALTACWLIALYVADELSYDRSFSKAGRIYRIVQHANWNGGSMNIVPTSAPFATALKANFPEVEDAVRIDVEGGGVIKYADKILKQDDICIADQSFFKVFDYDFLYGNAVSALSQPQSIVITESLAKKIFGDVSGALNQTILLGTENDPIKVTGVIKDMPENAHLQFSGIRSIENAWNKEGWQQFHLYTYLLLKQGVAVEAFEKKLPGFARQTVARDMGVKDYRMELQPLTAIHLHSNLDYELSANGSIQRVYLFIIIGALILMIALINYMNLCTARSVVRVKEIGIRKVLGSGRGHLTGLFISEAMLLTFIAALAACILVQLCLPFFNQLSGKNINVWQLGYFKPIVFVLLFALLTGSIGGSYPAFFLSHFKTIPSLKGNLGNLRANTLFRKSLIIFQFVIAVCLISGSFIIYRQMQYISRKDLGFSKEQVLTFHIDDTRVRSKIPELKHALLQNPVIEGVAVAGNPIGNNDLGASGYEYERNDGAASDNTLSVQELMIDGDYLRTMGIRLMAGRDFSEALPTDKTNAVLVNEALVKALGWKNPIGKELLKASEDDGKTQPKKVVGVITDFHTYSLQHKIEPLVMVMPQTVNDQDNLYVKIAKGETKKGVAYVKEVYKQFDNGNTAAIHFLDENFAKQYIAEQKQEQLSFVFTALAFIIVYLGLTGLVIFITVQRTKEVGIRKTLGASAGQIVRMLSAEFLKLVLIAALIAFPVAWWIMNIWLQQFAYRVTINWWIFAVAGLTALVVMLAAVGFQSVKAAIVSPVKSLRSE